MVERRGFKLRRQRDVPAARWICAIGVVFYGMTAWTGGQRGTAAVDLFRDYQLGSFDTVETAMSQVADWAAFERDVRSRIRDWPRNAGAAFSLEAALHAAEAANHEYRSPQYKRAYDILEVACTQLRRQRAPDRFELMWHLASISVLQAAGPELPVIATWANHLRNHVLARFPDEPKVRLAGVVLEKLMSWHGSPFRVSRCRDRTPRLRIKRWHHEPSSTCLAQSPIGTGPYSRKGSSDQK